MSGKVAAVVLVAAAALFGLSYAVGQATESDDSTEEAAGTDTSPRPAPPVRLRTASELPPLKVARRRRARRPRPAPAAPAPVRVRRAAPRRAAPRRTVAPAPSPAPSPAPAPRPRPAPSPPSPPPVQFDDSG